MGFYALPPNVRSLFVAYSLAAEVASRAIPIFSQTNLHIKTMA